MANLPPPTSAAQARLQSLSQQALTAQGLGGGIVTQHSLHGGGSMRQLIQYSTAQGSVVGVRDTPQTAQRFISVNQALAAKGVAVPVLLAQDIPAGVYVLEYLGDRTLGQHITQLRSSADRKTALIPLRQALSTLAHLHTAGRQALLQGDIPLGGGVNGPQVRQDIAIFLKHFSPLHAPASHPLATQAIAQLHLVTEEIAPHLAPPTQTSSAQTPSLQAPFTPTNAFALVFCHRDYQCRNLMWQAKQPNRQVVVIDHQDGGWGPLGYDVASLLYSPDTGLVQAERDALQTHYLDQLLRAIRQTGAPDPPAAFPQQFAVSMFTLVWLRRLQALGAYARIANQKKQSALLQKAPLAAQDLLTLQAEGHFPWPQHAALNKWLKEVLTRCAQSASNPTPA